ncbi:MAG: Leucine efflux protein [Syntrophorhabdaceae bacterium PtaU1.Bin034]|jgi:threonine/homoserine/homoserine lactone efflux protein|nr:MAG: Leucine efflux protein [Syntrophorhabdaceae bacterium PtaU1.Bin034]
METLLLFCATSLALVITPGPNQIYIITRSTSQGRRAGFISVLGVGSGTLVHIVAASLGLSALLISSALAFSIVKYSGAVYLIYLGIRTCLSRSDDPQTTTPAALCNGWQVFLQGMLTNVLNPKLALFFLAFLPQFIDRSLGHVAEQMLMLGLILIAIGFGIDLIVVFLASSVGDWLRQKTKLRRTQKWIAGGVYISLGVGTALTGAAKK